MAVRPMSFHMQEAQTRAQAAEAARDRDWRKDQAVRDFGMNIGQSLVGALGNFGVSAGVNAINDLLVRDERLASQGMLSPGKAPAFDMGKYLEGDPATEAAKARVQAESALSSRAPVSVPPKSPATPTTPAGVMGPPRPLPRRAQGVIDGMKAVAPSASSGADPYATAFPGASPPPQAPLLPRSQRPPAPPPHRAVVPAPTMQSRLQNAGRAVLAGAQPAPVPAASPPGAPAATSVPSPAPPSLPPAAAAPGVARPVAPVPAAPGSRAGEVDRVEDVATPRTLTLEDFMRIGRARYQELLASGETPEMAAKILASDMQRLKQSQELGTAVMKDRMALADARTGAATGASTIEKNELDGRLAQEIQPYKLQESRMNATESLANAQAKTTVRPLPNGRNFVPPTLFTAEGDPNKGTLGGRFGPQVMPPRGGGGGGGGGAGRVSARFPDATEVWAQQYSETKNDRGQNLQESVVVPEEYLDMVDPKLGKFRYIARADAPAIKAALDANDWQKAQALFRDANARYAKGYAAQTEAVTPPTKLQDRGERVVEKAQDAEVKFNEKATEVRSKIAKARANIQAAADKKFDSSKYADFKDANGKRLYKNKTAFQTALKSGALGAERDDFIRELEKPLAKDMALHRAALLPLAQRVYGADAATKVDEILGGGAPAPGPSETSPGQPPPPGQGADPLQALFDKIQAMPWPASKKRRAFAAEAAKLQQR